MNARVSAKTCSPLLRLARRVFKSLIGFSFGERRLLFGAGFLLVLGFPLGVRHAVNHFAGVVEADLDLAFVGSGLVPLGQAVAAETREVHQVDVLHVLAAVQVGDQSAEGGGFKFQALLIVHGCLCETALSGKLQAASWVAVAVSLPLEA